MGFARAGVNLFLCAVHSALLAYDLSLPDEAERVETLKPIRRKAIFSRPLTAHPTTQS